LPRKVLSSRQVDLSEAREALEGRESYLDTLQLRTLEYTRKFAKLGPETAKKLIKDLMEKYELLEEEAVQIVDICPRTVDELRTILSGYRRMVSFLLFSEDKMRDIVDLVQKALESKSIESSSKLAS